MKRPRRWMTILAILATAMVGFPASNASAVQQQQSVIVSADPADYTPNIVDPPHANYHVEAIAKVANKIYVGGEFTQVQDAGGGPIYPVANLFAFDASTGAIDTGFFPVVNGRVQALVAGADGQSLYVGGTFTTINGQTAKHVGLINTTNGDPVPGFKAKTSGQVKDMVLSGSVLYLAGSFSKVSGAPRSLLAGVDATTGAIDPDMTLSFTGTRKSTVSPFIADVDVTPDGSTLVAVGNFTNVAGASPARNQIVLVDLTTSPDSLLDWETERFVGNCSTHFSTYIRAVDFSPDGSYFAVGTTGASAVFFVGNYPSQPPLCDMTARFETAARGTALQPTWVDYVGGDTNYSVAVTGAAIYVGGHQRWQNNYFGRDSAGPGSVRRDGIAALSPLNGMPYAWNPGRIRGLGAQALLATDEGLWVGSDTDEIGGEYHAKMALMPVAGGETEPPAVAGTLPGDLDAILYTSGDLVSSTTDGSTFGAQTVLASGWGPNARGAFMLSGTLYTGWSDGHFYRQTLADGSVIGSQEDINLHGLESYGSISNNERGESQSPNMSVQLAGATGMFFDNGRLYYTVANDPTMYYRYFLPESRLLGSNRYRAFSTGSNCFAPPSGFSPCKVRGMTVANGQLYWGQDDGTLWSVGFVDGLPSGSPIQVSGPGIDGNDWNARGLFVRSDA